MTANNIIEPGFGFDLHWQMTRAERLAILHILEKLRPELSLEIGTYQGGSLQAISKFSKRVISLDIDPHIPKRLIGRFDNVTFKTGDSAQLLSGLIDELNETGPPEFVLIDGDHKCESVRRDIESVLRIKPKRSTVILMHDSFNPDCRKGVLTAPWESCSYVHDVEIDFMPGHFFDKMSDTALADEMWGGFACAILEPEARTGTLMIQQSRKLIFDLLQPLSAHARKIPDPKPVGPSAAIRIYRRARITAGRLRRQILGQPLP